MAHKTFEFKVATALKNYSLLVEQIVRKYGFQIDPPATKFICVYCYHKYKLLNTKNINLETDIYILFHLYRCYNSAIELTFDELDSYTTQKISTAQTIDLAKIEAINSYINIILYNNPRGIIVYDILKNIEVAIRNDNEYIIWLHDSRLIPIDHSNIKLTHLHIKILSNISENVFNMLRNKSTVEKVSVLNRAISESNYLFETSKNNNKVLENFIAYYII